MFFTCIQLEINGVKLTRNDDREYLESKQSRVFDTLKMDGYGVVFDKVCLMDQDPTID
jgi:hypothetical protein